MPQKPSQPDVIVRIKFKEIAEGLHGGDSAEDGIILRDRLLEKDFLQPFQIYRS